MVTVPSLPGCFSNGKTQESAIENVREAIELHVDGLIEHDQPVPHDDDVRPITTIIRVPVRQARSMGRLPTISAREMLGALSEPDLS